MVGLVEIRETPTSKRNSAKVGVVHTRSYETTFGTCDLCMSTGIHNEEHFVFETSDNNIITMENGYWDYGNYYKLLTIDNTADFAYWLNNQKFDGNVPETEEELQKIIPNIVLEYESSL